MKLTNLLLSIVIIVLTSWVFYEIGTTIDTNVASKFSILGAIIATIAIGLVILNPDRKSLEYAGVIFNFLVFFVAGCFFTIKPWLWITLCILNVPIYAFIAVQFYSSRDSFFFSVSNAFHGDNDYHIDNNEQIEGFKGLFYLSVCAAVVTMEYKLLIL